MLSFDLHPSWWFGRKMDDSDYEWRFWADFFSSNLYLFGLQGLIGLSINHQMEKVSIIISVTELIFKASIYVASEIHTHNTIFCLEDGHSLLCLVFISVALN